MMHHLKDVVEILEDHIYKEFTTQNIACVNTKEMSEVADILKDFIASMYYYKMILAEDTKDKDELIEE